MCANHAEDRNRLFFHCNCSRQIVEIIMRKLQINTGNYCDINQQLQILIQNQTSNHLFDSFKNIAFTTLLWHIWCERNSRIFKGIELPIQVRTMLTVQDCRYLMQRKSYSKKLSIEFKLILLNFGIVTDQTQDFRRPLI